MAGRHRRPEGRHRALDVRPLNPRPVSGRRIAIIAVLASALILYPASIGDEQGSVLGEVIVPFFQGEASASEEVMTDTPNDPPKDPAPVIDLPGAD